MESMKLINALTIMIANTITFCCNLLTLLIKRKTCLQIEEYVGMRIRDY